MGSLIKNIYLRQNVNISLLEVGSKILVLGVTNSNVSILDRISDPEEIKLIKQSATQVFSEEGFVYKFFSRFKKKKSSFEPLLNKSISSILSETNSVEDIK